MQLCDGGKRGQLHCAGACLLPVGGHEGCLSAASASQRDAAGEHSRSTPSPAELCVSQHTQTSTRSPNVPRHCITALSWSSACSAAVSRRALRALKSSSEAHLQRRPAQLLAQVVCLVAASFVVPEVGMLAYGWQRPGRKLQVTPPQTRQLQGLQTCSHTSPVAAAHPLLHQSARVPPWCCAWTTACTPESGCAQPSRSRALPLSRPPALGPQRPCAAAQRLAAVAAHQLSALVWQDLQHGVPVAQDLSPQRPLCHSKAQSVAQCSHPVVLRDHRAAITVQGGLNRSQEVHGSWAV